jgi:hypothetical protein
MTSITLNDITVLEKKAELGDEQAQKDLDKIAHDQGFTSYSEWMKSLVAPLQEAIQKNKELSKFIDQQRKKIESTPGAKYIWDYVNRLSKSKDPTHRTLAEYIKSHPIEDIHKIAQSFQEWLSYMPLPPSHEESEPPKKQYNDFDKARSEIRRNALKRMSYTGQGMTAQEEITLKLVDKLERDSQQNTRVVQRSAEKPVRKRGPNSETKASLARLREIRLDAIRNNRSIPTKAYAMSEAGITDKTWKIYDRDLWANWDIRSYRGEKQE